MLSRHFLAIGLAAAAWGSALPCKEARSEVPSLRTRCGTVQYEDGEFTQWSLMMMGRGRLNTRTHSAVDDASWKEVEIPTYFHVLANGTNRMPDGFISVSSAPNYFMSSCGRIANTG